MWLKRIEGIGNKKRVEIGLGSTDSVVQSRGAVYGNDLILFIFIF